MKYTRRRALAIGALGIGALSGCAQVASGDGPITREASPAVVGDTTLSETDHELERDQERTISREVSAGGQTRQVEATNHVTVYSASTEGPEGTEITTSLFGVVSTPAFTFAGQSFNPIADYDNQELLEFVSSEFGNLSVGETVGETTTTVLGTETTVTKFEATAAFGGQRVDAYAHVTSVEDGDDIVVAVGGYPRRLESSQEGDVEQLFGGIQHPTE